MFRSGTPESVGISSRNVLKFLRSLEESGLAMHSTLFLRGSTLFGEYYWKPFHREFCHRMYSQTKSLVSVAIGLLEEDGLVELDRPIVEYFPEKLDRQPHPYLKRQTVREMLTMTTSVHPLNWFTTADPDRVHEYFNASEVVRPAGTLFEYDSAGSQVLGALVEKLSGQSLFDFLTQRLFRHMNAFETATVLKTPNGDSWCDSAMICRPLDMLTFGKFVMDGGVWEGKRLMNADYLAKATARQVDNGDIAGGVYKGQGYGYQFWRHDMNGFSCNGMGGQFTICVPDKSFVFVCTADNQGNTSANYLLFRALKEHIVDKLDVPLPEDEAAYTALNAYADTLKLTALRGAPLSDTAAALSGKTFLCDSNRMGIRQFSFDFHEDSLSWQYENEQGEKRLVCGLCRNVFGKFPQYGYSNEVGGVRTTDGFLYDCAASAAWLEPNKLGVRVQIIDRYFGNFTAVFAFKGDLCAVRMTKTAEDFLDEYHGELTAHLLP